MVTNRTPIKRPRKESRLTPEVIAAWMACDWSALHCALDLNPFDTSPLPKEITLLGCSAEDHLPADADSGKVWVKSLRQAVELQRKLLAVAGWPDCRDVYEENLREAKEWLAYCRELIKHPERGGRGTGCDPVSRREDLEKAKAEVAYRKKLLADLKAKANAA